MAGSDQSKQSSRKKDRLGPSIAQGSSRVSKVVGSVGLQTTRVEQRSAPSAARQGSRRQAASKRAQGGKQGTKKGSPHANRPFISGSPSPDGSADSRVISKARNAWGNMQPHHQQRFLGILLLLLALFLFAVLTVFRSVPLFSAIGGTFMALFGWSAYLLAIGLIAFAFAHLVEGMQNKRFIRWSFVIGLILLWLLVLAESHFLLGGATGGVLGTLLVRPLLGWPPAVGHILLVGLFGVIIIATFRDIWRHRK